MTVVGVNTYTHSVTYVADNILKSLKDIIRLSGLNPSEFVGNWDLYMRGITTWLQTGDLEEVTLEIYNPKTDALIFLWKIEISYGWSGGDGAFWTDTEQLRYAIRKAGLVPSEARYRLMLFTKLDVPNVSGWSNATARSTEGMVRQSLGTTVEHSGLGASTSYLRRA
jgi:hypothetical protein